MDIFTKKHNQTIVAKWIMDKRFLGSIPIDIFQKEYSPSNSTRKHDEKLQNVHMLIRSNFQAENLEDCVAYITADDYYKLYVNGKYVCEGPAQSYHFSYWYNCIDISSYLVKGNNTIAVHLYYNGFSSRAYQSGDMRMGMMMQIEQCKEVIHITDNTWKYQISKAYDKGDFVGGGNRPTVYENFDARLWDEDWTSPDYNDSAWENCVVNYSDDHILFEQPTPLCDVYPIEPATITDFPDGSKLIDFGHTVTGYLIATFTGNSGDVVEIRYAEELTEDGHARYVMRCDSIYRETYALSDRLEDNLCTYDYKGFRYIELIPTGSAKVIKVGALQKNYPFDEKSCEFKCSNDLLKKIWDMCKLTIKVGSQEHYIDCPTREKGQYTADARITSNGQAYLIGDYRQMKKSLIDFALSSYVCPGLLAVAPGTLMQEIAEYSLSFPELVLKYYYFSADKEFLESMYDVLQNQIFHFKKFENEKGLLFNVNDKWNIVDWPESFRDDYDFDLSEPCGDGCHNSVNAYYGMFIRAISQIEDFLGKEHTYEYGRFAQAFNEVFFDSSKGLYRDAVGSEHHSFPASMLPLYAGLVSYENKPFLIEYLKMRGMVCGVYSSYYFLKALAANGEYYEVYQLLTSQKKNSWGNMLKDGATTCIEAWDLDNVKNNISMCHPWAASPITIIIEDLIGIQPVEPSWEKIRFASHIPDDVDMELTFHTPKGQVRFQSIDGKQDITIPKGMVIAQNSNYPTLN